MGVQDSESIHYCQSENGTKLNEKKGKDDTLGSGKSWSMS